MIKKIKTPTKPSRFRDSSSRQKLGWIHTALTGSSLLTHACTMHIHDRDIRSEDSPEAVIGNHLQTIFKRRVTTFLYVIEVNLKRHSFSSINTNFGYHVHVLVRLESDDILDEVVLRYCKNVKPAYPHTKATIRQRRSGTPILIQKIDDARGGLAGLIGVKGYLGKALGRRRLYQSSSSERSTRLRFSRDIGQLAEAAFEEEKKAVRAARKSGILALPLVGMTPGQLPAASSPTEISAQAGEGADLYQHGAVHLAVMHAGLVEVHPSHAHLGHDPAAQHIAPSDLHADILTYGQHQFVVGRQGTRLARLQVAFANKVRGKREGAVIGAMLRSAQNPVAVASVMFLMLIQELLFAGLIKLL